MGGTRAASTVRYSRIGTAVWVRHAVGHSVAVEAHQVCCGYAGSLAGACSGIPVSAGPNDHGPVVSPSLLVVHRSSSGSPVRLLHSITRSNGGKTNRGRCNHGGIVNCIRGIIQIQPW